MFITLVIVAAGIYFGLPIAFPNVTKTQSGVVQMKTVQVSDNAVLFETSTTPSMMNNTEISITTRGNTALFVEFNANFEIYLNLAANTGSGLTWWWRAHLILFIDNIGNNTTFLQYINYDTTIQMKKSETDTFTMQYATGVLPSGTYHAALNWSSDFSTGGNCQIIVSNAPNHIFYRSLTIQEIAAV